MAFVLLEDDEPQGSFQLLEDEPDSLAARALKTATSASLGAIQGGTDLAQLGALGLNPLERLIQSSFGQQDQGIQNTPGYQNRLNREQAILERLNAGERPSFSDLMMIDSEDDILPQRGTGTSLEAISQFQGQIPETGNIQEISRRATRSGPFALGGPGLLANALLSEGAGLAARRGVEAFGGTEEQASYADIGAGLLTGVLGGSLARAPASTGIPAALETEGSFFARAEIQGGKRALERNIQNVEKDLIQSWDDNVIQLSKKSFNEFPEFQSSEIANEVIKGNESALLNRISPVSAEQDAWRGVQQAIESAFEKEANVYRPLYNQVRDGANKIAYTARPTIEAAERGLARLSQISTQAPGYQAAENTLTSVLRDLGTSARIPPQLRALEAEGRIIGNQGFSREVPVSNLIELKTRLNDIRNYETLTPSIRDQVLEPVLQALRQDIRKGLAQAPELEAAFNQAESSYQRTAQRFNKDAIQSLRNSETPEAVASTFSRPSNIEALKSVLTPQEFQVAERQMIERLLSQSTENARQNFDQIERYLSPTAKQVGREAIDLGDKLTSSGQRKILQTRLLEDVQSAVTSGTRPETLLKSMRTPEGYNIAKQTFSTSAKGREIFKAAEKQFMADVFDSIITKEGRIDWQKASTLFTDPQIMEVIKDVGGKNSVAFIQRLSSYGYNISRNLERFGQQNSSWVSGLLGNLSTPTKTFLTGLIGTFAGLPQAIALMGGAQALKSGLLRLLSRPNAQQIIRSLSNPDNYSRKDLLTLFTRLNEYLTQEDDDGLSTE